ncbi:unknown [Bacteroides sp. CAG:633]|nr:unknown [Bacteroides sp. CAG:633]
MLFHHCLHIEQTEAVAFHFVQVAGGYSVELVEYVGQAVAGDADAVVADTDFCIDLSVCVRVMAATDGNVGLVARILHGIVQQIAYDVGQMGAVGRDGQVFGDDVERDVDRLVGFQLMQFDEGGQEGS